jgi:hypothetical protein
MEPNRKPDIHGLIARDVWAWVRDFIAVPNQFYDGRFSPCPFARQALSADTVDIVVWGSGGTREFIRHHAFGLVGDGKLTTRIMVLPPRTRPGAGLRDYVDELNRELIPGNVFLNPGIARGTRSRYPGSPDEPYSIVVANDLDAVLRGSEALHRTGYYDRWPAAHYEFVVQRRARLAALHSRKPGE